MSSDEQSPRPEMATSSGVKLTFTARGLCQPEITLRYATPELALQRAVDDTFTILAQITAAAAESGIRLVTEQEGK